MARLGFVLSTAGLLVKVKDEEQDLFIASTQSGVGYDFQVVDNNDGGYFVDGLPTGVYSIYVSSDESAQEEMQYYAFLGSNGITHIQDASDTGSQIWHHKINDAGDGADVLFSAAKIIALLIGKADAQDLVDLWTALNGKADAGHLHSDYLKAQSGQGYEVTNQLLSLLLDSQQLEFTGDNKLSLVRSFTNEAILKSNKTISQNLELLQNWILTWQTSEGGSFYQVLWSNARVDADPTQTSLPSYINETIFDNQNYEFHAIIPFFKIPEMRQAVYSFKAEASNLGNPATGFVKFKCGSIEREMEVNEGMGFSQFAIYLDLTSLANYEAHMLEIWGKVTTAITLVVDRELVALKQAITTTAGETSQAVQNPTA